MIKIIKKNLPKSQKMTIKIILNKIKNIKTNSKIKLINSLIEICDKND